MNRSALVPACVLCFLCALVQAQPLTTAFTFQGELRSGGTPVSGLWDLRFRLYDAASGGGQVGTTLCADNISVADGRFTVVLDFFLQFAGQKRFVEIEVRADTGLDCTSGAGFTLLSPRQELTATPNATFALNAAVATLATTATTATTATNAAQLNGQGAAFYQNAGNLTSGSIPGARLNGAYPGIVQMDNVGNSFGGAGTGLHDLNASNLSLGTLSAARLPVPLVLSGASGPTNFIISANTTSPDFNAMGIYGTASAPTGLTFGVQGRSDSTGGWATVGFATAPSGFTHGVHGVSNSTDGTGVFGIGTSATGGSTGVWGQSASPDGRGVYGVAGAFGGLFEGTSPFGAGVFGTGVAYGGQFRSAGNIGVFGETQSTTGTGTGVYGQSSAANGIGVRGVAGLPTNQENYGGHFTTFSSAGRGVLGLALAGSGATHGLHGQSDSSSDNAAGVFGLATAGSGITFGGYFSSHAAAGRGVYGQATDSAGVNYGVFGESFSTSGIGVKGLANAPGLSLSYGVWGESAGTIGTGVYGKASSFTGGATAVQGECNSVNGTGVYGVMNNVAAGGPNYGVRGASFNPNGYGVHGSGNTGVAGESGTNAGLAGYFHGRGGDAVYIENYGSGRGLHAVAPSDTAIWGESSGGLAGVHGATSNVNGYGVLGINGGTTGNSYGVVGQTSSGAGWGLFAFGRSGASGVKTFRIDHPDDPENKYLLHYSTEGPEVLNAYSGTAALNEQGEAVVALPAYFARINKDPRYTLTAIGAPMPLLHIGEEISGADLEQGAKAEPGQALPVCSFRIAGGAAGAKVCWRVEAVRNDRWVRRHGAPVEVEKQGVERGTYQEPELYGRPPEKGMMRGEARTPDEEPVVAAPRGG